MFDIEYKGGNCVVISTKKATVVLDPKLSIYGENDIVISDAVELTTENIFRTDDERFQLSLNYPGSYEVSDFSINGFAERRHLDSESDGKNSTIYSIKVSDVNIGVVGNIAPDVAEEQFENLGVVDILILPVGGNGYTLDATSAAKIARNIDAKIIIPVNYAEDDINYEVPQDSVELFTKEMGLDVERMKSLKIKSAANIPEKPVIYILERTK